MLRDLSALLTSHDDIVNLQCHLNFLQFLSLVSLNELLCVVSFELGERSDLVIAAVSTENRGLGRRCMDSVQATISSWMLEYSVLCVRVSGVPDRIGSGAPVTACAFIFRRSPSRSSIYWSTPPTTTALTLHATFSDYHAALSARPSTVLAGGCAPRAGIPSRRGLIPALYQPEFYPLDSLISSMLTNDAEDNVDDLI